EVHRHPPAESSVGTRSPNTYPKYLELRRWQSAVPTSTSTPSRPQRRQRSQPTREGPSPRSSYNGLTVPSGSLSDRSVPEPPGLPSLSGCMSTEISIPAVSDFGTKPLRARLLGDSSSIAHCFDCPCALGTTMTIQPRGLVHWKP